MKIGNWITTDEAAALTGYTRAHIRVLARGGSVEAVKAGRDWLVDRQSVIEHKREMDALGDAKHSPTRGKGVRDA